MNSNINLKHKHKQAPASPKLDEFRFFVQQAFLSSPEGAKFSKGYGFEPVNGYGQLWDSARSGFVPNCPLGVPSNLQRDDFAPPTAKGPRVPPPKKYPTLYNEAEKGYIPDMLLLATFQRRMSERPLVYSEGHDGDVYMFHGMIKGCPDYNKKLEAKIIDKSTQLLNTFNSFYFLTVTYAQNIHGKNIPEAWQIFNIQLGKLMHSVRRKYDSGYACVLESTYKGYPHAHIILALQKTPDAKHRIMKPGSKIKYGKLHQFLKERMPSPQWNLQVADVKGIESYLTKYVAKGLEKLITPEESGQKELGKDEKKALMSCMCPILASVRQFRSSIRGSANNAVLDDLIAPDVKNKIEDATKLGIWSSEASAALITLLTNLTDICRAHAWAIFNGHGKKAYSDGIGFYDNSNGEVIKEFKRHAYPLGCPGCAITDLLDAVNNFKPVQPEIITTNYAKNLSYLVQSGRSLAEIYSYIASAPDGWENTLSDKDKKDLSDMGIVVNIDYVGVNEKFIRRGEKK